MSVQDFFSDNPIKIHIHAISIFILLANNQGQAQRKTARNKPPLCHAASMPVRNQEPRKPERRQSKKGPGSVFRVGAICECPCTPLTG